MAAVDVKEAHFDLIRAALANEVRNHLSVFADVRQADIGGVLWTHRSGIDQQDVRRIRSLTHVDREEVLTDAALSKEIAAVANNRCAQLIRAEQRLDARRQTLLAGEVVEDRVGVCVLPIDPCPRLRTLLIFEPAVRIADLDPLDRLRDGTDFALRRRRDLVDRPRRAAGGDGESKQSSSESAHHHGNLLGNNGANSNPQDVDSTRMLLSVPVAPNGRSLSTFRTITSLRNAPPLVAG